MTHTLNAKLSTIKKLITREKVMARGVISRKLLLVINWDISGQLYLHTFTVLISAKMNFSSAEEMH